MKMNVLKYLLETNKNIYDRHEVSLNFITRKLAQKHFELK